MRNIQSVVCRRIAYTKSAEFRAHLSYSAVGKPYKCVAVKAYIAKAQLYAKRNALRKRGILRFFLRSKPCGNVLLCAEGHTRGNIVLAEPERRRNLVKACNVLFYIKGKIYGYFKSEKLYFAFQRSLFALVAQRKFTAEQLFDKRVRVKQCRTAFPVCAIYRRIGYRSRRCTRRTVLGSKRVKPKLVFISAYCEVQRFFAVFVRHIQLYSTNARPVKSNA